MYNYIESSHENMPFLARKMLTDYEEIGLEGILNFKRKNGDKVGYIKEDEATAIAISF
jgi:hypothetical protein